MTTNTDAVPMSDETLRKILSRVWQLGQTYWQQADSDSYKQQDKSDETRNKYLALVEESCCLLSASKPAALFQERVQPWMMACFGAEIAADRIERNHRFFEEATEAVQANGMTRSEAHQLVDYTFDRPVGELHQEIGGVMVTLAALCLASGEDMHAAGETELERIWTKVDAIRAKQAAKPKHSPLPAAPTQSTDALTRELLDTLQMMVLHFTQTPSTLADSEARGKAHEVIAKAYAQIGYSAAPAQSGEPMAWCRGDTLAEWKGQMINAAYMFPSPRGLTNPVALYASPQPSQPAQAGDERTGVAERALLAAGQWATSTTPVTVALAYRDGYVAGARSAVVLDDEQAIPVDYDVRKILLRVVPGDGGGHEVYAKNVAEVEALLSEMGARLEDLDLSRAASAAWGISGTRAELIVERDTAIRERDEARAASPQPVAQTDAVGWFVQRTEFGPWVEIEKQEPGAVQFYRAAQAQPAQTDDASEVAADDARWQPIETAPRDQLVMVYTPPTPDDWPDSIRIDFDHRASEDDGDYWVNHSEHFEHYMAVGGSGAAGPDVICKGPSEKAPYTHWMPLPKQPIDTALAAAQSTQTEPERCMCSGLGPCMHPGSVSCRKDSAAQPESGGDRG